MNYEIFVNKLTEELKIAFINLYGHNLPNDFSVSIVSSNKSQEADLQCNDCFKLARSLRKSPAVISQELVDSLKSKQENVVLSAAGNGFINIKIKDSLLCNLINSFNFDAIVEKKLKTDLLFLIILPQILLRQCMWGI